MRLGPNELENERERRRKYYDRLVVRRPDGVTEGADPRTLPRELLAEVHQPSPILDVIREKCLDCSGYQPSEIARCTAIACSLWPYRMASNPFRAPRELSPEQREAGAARLAAARVRGRSASETAAPVAEHRKYQGENERGDSAGTKKPGTSAPALEPSVTVEIGAQNELALT